MQNTALLAEVVRNGLVESIHSGYLVEIGSDGSVSRAMGDVKHPVYPRSAIKTLQASAMVRAGLKLSPEQLAIVCASHSGSEDHFRIIRSVLAGAGLDESALGCALGKPIGTDEALAWGDKESTRLAMNCSGKHSGMLATCVVNGWDIKSYLSPSHPLQVAIAKEIETLVGEPLQYETADGCGAPLWAYSTQGLARAIHTLTVSTDPVHQEVVAAHRAFPIMTGGIGRLGTRMMQAVPGLVMKEGAEGVLIFSVPDGRACAIKFADGSFRAAGPVAAAMLKGWGISSPDERVDVLGGGNVVGQVVAVLN